VGDVGDERLDPRERALADLVEDLATHSTRRESHSGVSVMLRAVREEDVDVLDAVLEGVLLHGLLQRAALDGVGGDALHRVVRQGVRGLAGRRPLVLLEHVASAHLVLVLFSWVTTSSEAEVSVCVSVLSVDVAALSRAAPTM
jgi:hypothetical protein